MRDISRQRIGGGRRGAFQERRRSSFFQPGTAVGRGDAPTATETGDARQGRAAAAAADDKGARRRLGGRPPHKRPSALRKTPVGLSSPTQPAPRRDDGRSLDCTRVHRDGEDSSPLGDDQDRNCWQGASMSVARCIGTKPRRGERNSRRLCRRRRIPAP